MATNTKTSATGKASEKEKNTIPKDIDPNMTIPVRNGFQGGLVYVSPRTKEVYRWEEFNEIQEVELRELRNAKSASKAFFMNNWFMFDDEYDWVIDYLGVRQYYENALSINEFETLFTLSPAEITKVISKLSKGQKRSVAYKAKQMVADGEIDSNKVIATLEKALGVELVEK